MSPSKHPYTIVLTHDVDHLRLRDYPLFSRYTLSFTKNAVFNNISRLFKGDIGLGTYIKSKLSGFSVPLVKLGIIRDPLEKCFNRILAIEKQYDVRSTFYFIPYKNRAGFDEQGNPAKPNRGCHYDVTRHAETLKDLEDNGWEVGIHGIDAHLGVQQAQEELAVFQKLLPHKEKWGMRMHWLYQPPDLWKNLKRAGFYYDATYGTNDEAGFIDHHYIPFEKDGLPVVPLTIQDGTLMAKWRKRLSVSQAWLEIRTILETARKNNAVVTVLWHNASFGPPRYWDSLYENIIRQGKQDGAQFITALQAAETVKE